MSLVFSGVSYRYPGTRSPALRRIGLRVEPGEVVGVVGANESGKSTLCLVASGLAPGTVSGRLEGSVRIDDIDTTQAMAWELAQRCGILFQNPATQLSGTTATVWEEVAFGPRNLALALGEVIDRVDWALTQMGVMDLVARDPARLSGGQAQLVALAAVLAMRPAYVVLDEPTSQLDPHGTRQVAEALTGLAAAAGVGLLITEHKTELLASVASRIAVLANGEVVAEGPVGAVLGDERLTEWGVRPPPAVVLQRAAAAAGLTLPASGAT